MACKCLQRRRVGRARAGARKVFGAAQCSERNESEGFFRFSHHLFGGDISDQRCERSTLGVRLNAAKPPVTTWDRSLLGTRQEKPQCKSAGWSAYGFGPCWPHLSSA